MKDPVKFARKELPRWGAVVASDWGRSILFDMPFGGRLLVEHRTPMSKIVEIVASFREKLNPLIGYVPERDVRPLGVKPSVSKHFMERFDLMREQEDLTPDEVHTALSNPSRVYRAGRRLAFERGRVVVIVHQHQEGCRLITVLWASEELWARNPRPGKEQ